MLVAAGLLSWFFSAGIARANGPAAASCPEGAQATAVARIQARYESISDLEARFEQTSHSVVMGSGSPADASVSRGTVIFAKPGKMRWSYVSPEPSLVVSDGSTLWIHDVGARQVSRMSVAQGYLAGAALQFLMGEGRLDSEFVISLRECPNGEVDLDLVPKQPASYERLGLRARLESGMIVATTIVDLFGNRTIVAFEDVRFDRKPGPATFRFDPSPGVEVIDLDRPSPDS